MQNKFSLQNEADISSMTDLHVLNNVLLKNGLFVVSVKCIQMLDVKMMTFVIVFVGQTKCSKLMKTIDTHACNRGHHCHDLNDEKKYFDCHLCNKNLSVCAICKETCKKVASAVMKYPHLAHKHCLKDLYNLIHKCEKDSLKKWTDISNEIDSLTSFQFHIEEASKETKHVNNKKDKVYYKKKWKTGKRFRFVLSL